MIILHLDDHPLFSRGLHSTLSQLMPQHDFLSTRNCQEAMQLIQSRSPDLILLDLSMPGISGIDFMKNLREQEKIIPIAICSAIERREEIGQAFELGAIAYLPKEWSEVELAKAIDCIEQGDMVVPPHIQTLLDTTTNKTNQQMGNISGRQKEVLELIAQGLSNKEIGKNLGIEENTVKSHVKALFQALSSKNRLDCVNRARELGLIN